MIHARLPRPTNLYLLEVPGVRVLADYDPFCSRQVLSPGNRRDTSRQPSYYQTQTSWVWCWRSANTAVSCTERDFAGTNLYRPWPLKLPDGTDL